MPEGAGWINMYGLIDAVMEFIDPIPLRINQTTPSLSHIHESLMNDALMLPRPDGNGMSC